jgi:hypothetical protein
MTEDAHQAGHSLLGSHGVDVLAAQQHAAQRRHRHRQARDQQRDQVHRPRRFPRHARPVADQRHRLGIGAGRCREHGEAGVRGRYSPAPPCSAAGRPAWAESPLPGSGGETAGI